ncbi:MAG: dihydrofolate reductase family protein [Bacteroidota bacterium]
MYFPGIKNLKKQKGKDIAVLGSAGLVETLLNLQLVDEYFLLVYPVVLGKRKSLFPDSSALLKSELLETISFQKSGIVKLSYAPQ